MITANGKLTPNYEYIADLRAKRGARKQQVSTNKKVLILGAGYVSEPVVEYLCRDPNLEVTVCSSLKKEVDKLAAKYTQIVPNILDIDRSQEEVEKLIKGQNVVISLLPYSYHPSIAETCIKYKVNMVTASYLSKGMQDLHDRAVNAGVTIVNEVGVDPG